MLTRYDRDGVVEMSYSPVRNEDSLSEYFSASSDFYVASKNLIRYRDDIDNFIIWFDKCYNIDPRAAVIYVHSIRDQLSSKIRLYVKPFILKYRMRLV